MVSGYYILPQADEFPDSTPRNWILQGWTGIRWEIIDARSEVGWTSGGKYFDIQANVNCQKDYSKYRLNITSVNGSDVVSICQFKLF